MQTIISINGKPFTVQKNCIKITDAVFSTNARGFANMRPEGGANDAGYSVYERLVIHQQYIIPDFFFYTTGRFTDISIIVFMIARYPVMTLKLSDR